MRPHRRIGHHRPAVRCPIDRRVRRRAASPSRAESAIPEGRAGRAAPSIRVGVAGSIQLSGCVVVWAGGVGRSEDTSMDSSRRTARRRRGLLAVAGAVMISVTAATGSPFAGAAPTPPAAEAATTRRPPASCAATCCCVESGSSHGAFPTTLRLIPRATVYSGINNGRELDRRLLRLRCNAQRPPPRVRRRLDARGLRRGA